MNWQNFIRGLLVSTIIFGLVLLVLTIFLNPENGPVTIGIYYVSVFAFVGGLFSIIGFFLRRWWRHNEIVFENIKISIRQGYLLAAVACALLALSAMGLLTWWDAAIVLISGFLFELYFKMRA